jgi:regulator of PEP synthase PpsR (kinase-PPPase family)
VVQKGTGDMGDENYLKKLQAVEFAMKCDDGKGAEFLPEADLIILGVSRTGKTPLSLHIAWEGYKAANIPLIPETDPPAELKNLDSSRIIGISLCPERLMKVRRERLKLLGLEPSASAYSSRERIDRELQYAADYMKALGAPVFDITDLAVEETARMILGFLKDKDVLEPSRHR